MSVLNLKHFLIALLLPSATLAQSIVVRDAADAPTPIAIQAFVRDNEDRDRQVAIDVEAALTANLIFSRIFRVIPAEAFLEPRVVGPIETFQVDSWRQVGADLVVRARVFREGNRTAIEGFVFNTTTARVVLRQTYRTDRRDYTNLAHMFGDDIVELITGQKGLFSTKIAFVYQAPGSRYKEVWTMDFNGRNPEPTVQNNRTNLSPTWTNDGRFLYYTSASTIHWNIWRSDLRGNSKQITNFPGSALGPSMMPDGKSFLVSLSKDGNPELYHLTLDGKVISRLTTLSTIEIAPSASPDGKKMCYSSGRLGNLHVFVMDLESRQSVRTTRVGTLNDSCSWHPRENRILFSGMDVDREFDIFSMDDQGNNMTRITYDARNNETPDWSPDGSLVVFSSRRSGREEIYIMKADGSQVTKITDLPGDATMPSWSPRLGY